MNPFIIGLMRGRFACLDDFISIEKALLIKRRLYWSEVSSDALSSAEVDASDVSASSALGSSPL